MPVSTATAMSPHSDLHILLVEDNDGDALLIENYLNRADQHLFGGGIDLHRAHDLTAAIDWVGRKSCDVILLDLGLPESQGLGTLERILVHSARIPVVILTGLRDRDTAFRAVRKGAEDYLHKDQLTGEQLARSLRYAIERQERKLATDVLESATLALMLVDWNTEERQVVFVNPACTELTGYSAEQWFDDGLALLRGEEDSHDVLEALNTAVTQGDPGQVEQHTRRRDGSSFWNRIHAIPITASGGDVTHVLYSFDDISAEIEWRGRMADVDRMSTLGTIAVGLAHEINNPLAFIAPNVQYVLRTLQTDVDEPPDLSDEEVRADLRDALEDAMVGVGRVRSVVDDLRQLAGRPEAIEFETELLSVVDPIHSSLTLTRNLIADRAKLVRYFEDVPKVEGNAAKLGQVFLNLLLNAAQAIPEEAAGSNEVRVSIYQRDDQVVVAISDTGVGIPDKNQEELFTPFFSTKDAGEGTGLGLPISKHIVAQHGGDIEIDSTVGEGTTVSVILPAVDED